MDSIHSKRVLFLGEQDGSVEQQLKEQVISCFSSIGGVASAYLVRVSYAETNAPFVALCLAGDKTKHRTIAECIGGVFKALFAPTVALDIVFLSSLQVAEIEKVAKPFFVHSIT